MNHTAADDADAASTMCLPRDVLASVLLRLPASDLRRFRRVCKEWRDVISDPVFINEHMDHGPCAPLTHTIVFLPGRGARNGEGFLFDENWRLVAKFTAGESEKMVGSCNGLLCFLDVHQGAINVVEPFTGESLVLPLPPTMESICDPSAYCFGFDPGSRRYKIFHLGLDYLTDGTTEQDLHVYTIGGGDNWKSVHVTGAAEPGEFNRQPVFAAADGSLYWPVHTDQLGKVARFDLATEEIRSEPILDFLEVDMGYHVMTDSGARVCVMTVGSFGEWAVFFMGEGGRWTQSGCNDDAGLPMLPSGRRLALPQALQRGHLLLEDYREGGIYIHPAWNNDLGSGKLLLKSKTGKEKDKEPAKSKTRGLFVPALFDFDQVPAMVRRVPQEWSSTSAATFCYAPPLSPTPLAHHRCGSPQTLAENKVTSRS